MSLKTNACRWCGLNTGVNVFPSEEAAQSPKPRILSL